MGDMLYATHAVVDLEALRYNMGAVRERVGSRQVLVAVKADAYGHGAVPVARVLQDDGLADWLGVATTPEGLQLRRAGIRLPILRLSPAFPEEIATDLANAITLPVHDADTIEAIAAQAAGRQVSVHLAVDTGMHRIGCAPGQAAALVRLAARRGLDVQGIYTHLPVADVPDGAQFTRDQLGVFLAAVDDVQSTRAELGLAPVELIHASNSGAVLGHELTGLTMVRPGIMVYGYYPDAQTPRTVQLHPMLELRTRVSSVRMVPAGDTVGYARAWTAPSDRWVATVSIGYADGFSRLNSNRGRMLVGGVSYPVIGRVCMDQTMLDAGPASGHCPVNVGDEVMVLGRQGDEQISVDELAQVMGTISYEVTCLLSGRVERLYR